MRNYIQRGKHITVPAAPRTLESGEGVQIGAALFGAATGPVASGEELVIATEGVVELVKVTGTAFGLGDVLYWDNAAFNLTKDEADHLAVGICVQAAGSDATVARIKLGAPPAIIAGT